MLRPIRSKGIIDVVEGDIFKQDVDAIVNPANRLMMHGGGLASVIAKRAGVQLEKESHAMAPVPIGQAITTTAGKLPFKKVIHTVGPCWGDQPEEQSDLLLGLAHRNAIAQAANHDLKSIAMPAISCGIFHFPAERAAPIAVMSVRHGMRDFWTVKRVVFCLMDHDHYLAFQAAAERKPHWWQRRAR
jgi:O-acetyl-ADP-ribose deacetylase